VPISPALRRLLCIRELEEDQSRLLLESALGELNQLETALTATAQRGRHGRKLVASSAQSGNLPDRVAGLEETHAAGRLAHALSDRIATAELLVVELRKGFLSKRLQRHQAETLIQAAEAREALETGRRGQRELDDWHRLRTFGESEREVLKR